MSDPNEPTRLIGHDLKCALAGAWRAAELLTRHMVPGTSSELATAELHRALAEADHMAEALLDRDAIPSAGRPHIEVDALLSWMETSLKQTLPSSVSLTFRLSGSGGAVLASTDELESLIRNLVDGAALAMPDGGEVTIGTGWLDHVSSTWPRTRFWPRRHVRLTVSDTGHGRYADTWQRVLSAPTTRQSMAFVQDSVAEVVGRLGGCLILESAEGDGSRVHVCLPAAPARPDEPDTPGTPGTPTDWPPDAA